MLPFFFFFGGGGGVEFSVSFEDTFSLQGCKQLLNEVEVVGLKKYFIQIICM